MIVFFFTCFCCAAVCSTLCSLYPSRGTHARHPYARNAYTCLCGLIFVCGACTLESYGAASCFFCVFTVFLIAHFLLFLIVFFLCVFLAGQLLRGCVLFFDLSLISTASWCVCCYWWTVRCLAVCSGLVFLLFVSLCVDGALVCAEGCTQVTGVMATMMTGRVLLVCALCVLWCVTAGGRCDEEETAGSGTGGGSLPESKQLETSPQDTQGPKDEARSLEGKELLTSSEDEAEEEEEDNDDDDEEEEEKEKSNGKED
ncbi:mucin-associated surface protein (MASP), putative, partial [Trypanosoma cruzi]